MTRISLVSGGLLLMVIGGPSLAQAASPAVILEPSPDQQIENKTICKSETISGSRFQTRVCHTNKEWETIRQQSMREMSETATTKFGSDSNNSEAMDNRQPQ